MDSKIPSPSPSFDGERYTYEEVSYEEMSKLWSMQARRDSSTSLVSTDVSESAHDPEDSTELSCKNDSAFRTRCSSNKSVSFSDELLIRTHCVVLGDSPCCPMLPIQLDWSYDMETLDLDEFESSRTTIRRRKRGPRKLLFYERSELLQDVAGYSPKELTEKKQAAEQRIKEENTAKAAKAELSADYGEDQKTQE